MLFNFVSGVTGTRGVTCDSRGSTLASGTSQCSDFGFDQTSSPSSHVQRHTRQRGRPQRFWPFSRDISPPHPLYDPGKLNHMQQESPPSFFPHLAQRFQSLVWSCLDSDLPRTAVFHAERYYALDQNNHDARHLYATALLREGQTYSAISLVTVSPNTQCSGCLEIKAKCSTALGRHRQAREALEGTLQDTIYVPSGTCLHSP